MNLGDIMARPVVGIRPTETVFQAARRMADAGCDFLPILVGGRVAGSITATDLIEGIASKIRAEDTPVAALDTGLPLCLAKETEVEDTAVEMARVHARHVVVVDDCGVACGIVGFTEIANHAADVTVARALRRVLEADQDRYPLRDFLFPVPGVS